MDKENFTITINITCGKDDERGLQLSLNEVVEKINEGYLSGMDGNEDEEYTFGVHKMDEDSPPLLVFKEKASRLLGRLEDLLDLFNDDGDTSETSQKLLLQQAINEVSYAVNGTVKGDFKKED
tara:strand:- start:33112 stop:33480 length:369 start_codon:yes stop_codon:yes gene_type:complete